MTINPDLIRHRILVVKRDIPREEHFLKPLTGEICQRVYEHMCNAEKDHVCTLVRDSKGIQVFSCCVGGFYANLENVADPYLLTAEFTEPKDFFVAICEYFMAEAGIE